MRMPIMNSLSAMAFDKLFDHAEKIKEGIWIFQQAMECYIGSACPSFAELQDSVAGLEREADGIKHQVLELMPISVLFPVDKHQFCGWLNKQDQLLNLCVGTLGWIRHRSFSTISDELKSRFILLLDAIIDPVEELEKLAHETRKYLRSFSDKHRKTVLDVIQIIRQQQREAARIGNAIEEIVFSSEIDPLGAYYLIRLSEKIGSIADQVEGISDIARAMVLK
ncbi:DUF47 domain-containing protein [Desulfatirhabdium butyrativorans]|uniref:DUF47 domain-containing protein n=1 Tax=Desulfatirhabdium butyrativorans TaxID=340467 RepID=UPI0003FC2C5D|nr:DUF47 family protein [Desulfatirhabdium butyrativorans]